MFIFIWFYDKDCLNYLLNRKLEIFDKKEIEQLVQNNNIIELTKKIKIVLDLKKRIFSNANINLLLDKLVISLTR